MFLTGGSVTVGSNFLSHAALLYFFIAIPARLLLGPPQAFALKVDHLGDCILASEFLLLIYDVVVEDGYIRSKRSFWNKVKRDWNRVLLQLLSIVDFLLGLSHDLPLLRLLRTPALFFDPILMEDLKWSTYQSAVFQLSLILSFEFISSAVNPLVGFTLLTGTRLLFLMFIGLGFTAYQSQKERRRSSTDLFMSEVLLDTDHPPMEVNDQWDELCKRIVQRSPLFRDAIQQDAGLLPGLLARLKHETFPPGSALTTIGETGRHMYFLAHGRIIGKSIHGKVFTLLPESCFGEIALMVPTSKRTASLVAQTRCDVFILDQGAFDILRTAHPILSSIVRAHVEKYLQNDSRIYVMKCLRQSLECCFLVALAMLASFYLLFVLF